MVKICFFFIAFCLSFTVYSQSPWRVFIPINTNVGLAFARFTQETSTNAPPLIQQPGFAIAVASGILLRYKTHFGIALEGGISLVQYTFQQRSEDFVASNGFAHYCFKTQLRPFVLFPLQNNPHALLRIECTGGLHFINSSQLSTEKNGLVITASSIDQNTFFIQPEIGLSKIMHTNQMDIGINYQINLSKKDLLHAQITSPTVNATIFTRMNYLALSVRFNPELIFSERQKKVVLESTNETNNELSETIANRTHIERNPYYFKRKRVVLKVWDNSEIDGDTITIAFNGKIILENYGLVKSKKKLKIKLNPGENTLVVIANNLGSIPPNTAAVKLRNGFQSHFLLTSTTLRKNEQLKFVYRE
jgi:hypothetical protein